MDLKKSSITADILNFLSDGKIHTLQEIADEVEVSKMTVRRHIQSLSYRYPIQTFCGGNDRGGVYLDKNYIYQGATLSNNELQLIVKGLSLLQKTNDQSLDKETISNLIDRYSPTKSEDIEK